MNTEEILRQVAAGELTPEQALPLLDAATPAAPASVTSAPASEPKAPAEPSLPRETPEPEPTARPSGAPQTRSTPHSPSRSPRCGSTPPTDRLESVADPTVAQIAVTGQHTVRREGTTLVVESMDSPFHLGEAGEPGTRGQAEFHLRRPAPRPGVGQVVDRATARRPGQPQLPVQLDAAGASVKISGIEGGAKLRVIAAALKLERVRGPLDLDVLSSSVKGFAAPTGTSKIACESSSVKLLLGAGSDVRITARNRLGKVVLPTAVSKGGLVDPDVTEGAIGAGRGTLTIDALRMSSVMLTRDDA